MKILKCTDTIKLTIDPKIEGESEGSFSVIVKPLSVTEKIDISSKVKIVKGEEIPDNQMQALLCVKYCVKDVLGVTNHDDTPYKVEFCEDGTLTDSSADDIISLLSDTALLAPVVLAANRSLSNIKGVEVQVNPKS
jgi:hypothetical protein